MREKINHAAVRELAAEWGVTGRVTINRTATKSWAGAHVMDDAGDHVIDVNGRYEAPQVADTIAHELCHARQASEAGRRWYALIEDQYGAALTTRSLPGDYCEIPLEAEAIAFAAEHADEVMRRCFKVAS